VSNALSISAERYFTGFSRTYGAWRGDFGGGEQSACGLAKAVRNFLKVQKRWISSAALDVAQVAWVQVCPESQFLDGQAFLKPELPYLFAHRYLKLSLHWSSAMGHLSPQSIEHYLAAASHYKPEDSIFTRSSEEKQ
jgi:hypothetical protein